MLAGNYWSELSKSLNHSFLVLDVIFKFCPLAKPKSAAYCVSVIGAKLLPWFQAQRPPKSLKVNQKESDIQYVRGRLSYSSRSVKSRQLRHKSGELGSSLASSIIFTSELSYLSLSCCCCCFLMCKVKALNIPYLMKIKY